METIKSKRFVCSADFGKWNLPAFWENLPGDCVRTFARNACSSAVTGILSVGGSSYYFRHRNHSCINLGNDNGLDLLAWMLQKPETRELPVIAVTAHALGRSKSGS
jgi:hypothetical protein